MPKLKAEAPDVDLKCILCPKNPSFSDVSHLLTHIASKSHLANKFKLEVESRHQAEAKNKLDDFDFWYNTNNLDDMLSDRMVAKEDKKKRKTRAASVKQDFKAPKTQNDGSEFRAPPARMHHPPLSRASTSNSISTGQPEKSIYSTPTARSKVPNFSDQETPADIHVDPKLMTPWKPDPECDETAKNSIEQTTNSNSARLKGIQWPGMRVFDAATPEGKRMRNQRKDSKVLRDMMATSRGVEPAEISYHANGEFRASRDIFGPLSTESSPVQARRATPKKRKARKPTFNNMSTNNPRPRTTRSKKNSTSVDQFNKNKFAVADAYRHSIFDQPPPTLNPLAAGFSGFNGNQYMPMVDEDEEYKLTIGDFGKKKEFTIFEDNISPGRTESPLEEPRFEFHQHHGLPVWSDNSMASGHIPPSPTPVPKQASRNMMNRSSSSNSNSGQPEMQNHFHTRRTMSDSQVFAPNAFLHDFNPLFNHGSHGYSRPLGSYGSQYLFGGHHTNNYVDNMNGSTSGYGSNFMGDFRHLNPMANASTNQLQSQTITSVADLEIGNENELPFM